MSATLAAGLLILGAAMAFASNYCNAIRWALRLVDGDVTPRRS
jgi:hypothetical protein